MSLFQDLKLKRRKTSSVLVVETTSGKSTSSPANFVAQQQQQQQTSSATSPNSSSTNSNSPTLLNQLLLQRANSPTRFETTTKHDQLNAQQLNHHQQQQQQSNNLIFATGSNRSNVIVANKRAVDPTTATKQNGSNGQTCAVITCGTSTAATVGKANNGNKTVIQQFRSNSFSSSNSSLSPSSSPPTALLPISSSGSAIHHPNPNYDHLNQNASTTKLSSTKLTNNSTNLNNCFNGLLQHSQSINSSGNSSPPSASSSCSPPPSTASSAVSLFEIDSDQCLDLTSSTALSTLTTVSLTTCSSTLTTSTVNNQLNNKPTIISKPFIAHQTIIKLKPTPSDLNTTSSTSNRCSSLEHNFQLKQTAKLSNSCLTATGEQQVPATLLAIDTSNRSTTFPSDSNASSNSKISNNTSLDYASNINNNQNSFRQTKGQTFMLATATATTEHIPTTFNNQQFTNHSTSTTNSTAVVSSCKASNLSLNGNHGSPKTMLWTLVNPGSIVNANILFATIPSATSTSTSTNLTNSKPDNGKLSAAVSTTGLVQCIKPTTLVNSSNNKCITSAVLTSAPTPVLKYTAFVAPTNTTLTSANMSVDENDESKVLNAGHTSNVSLCELIII